MVSTGPASTTQCHVGIPSFFCLLAHFFWITVLISKLSVWCMLKKGNIYLWISWLTGLFSIIKEIINSTRMALLSAVIQLTHSSVKGPCSLPFLYMLPLWVYWLNMMDTMNHTLLLSETDENVEVTLLLGSTRLDAQHFSDYRYHSCFHRVSIKQISCKMRYRKKLPLSGSCRHPEVSGTIIFVMLHE